jgi:hypothetical protein
MSTFALLNLCSHRFMAPPNLPEIMFCGYMVDCNNLHAKGFSCWAFYPGMLFQSMERWWGNGGNRNKSHEGIDLCLYRDTSGNIYCLDKAAQIPVLYKGFIKRIIDDYLGKTVFVAHDIHDGKGNQFYTIYGHLELLEGIESGLILEEGRIFASITDGEKKRLSILPHVHISVAWIPENFPLANLNWEVMNESPRITLLNPLNFFNGNYTILLQTSCVSTWI